MEADPDDIEAQTIVKEAIVPKININPVTRLMGMILLNVYNIVTIVTRWERTVLMSNESLIDVSPLLPSREYRWCRVIVVHCIVHRVSNIRDTFKWDYILQKVINMVSALC